MLALLWFNLRARRIERLTTRYRREVPQPVFVWMQESWSARRRYTQTQARKRRWTLLLVRG